MRIDVSVSDVCGRFFLPAAWIMELFAFKNYAYTCRPSLHSVLLYADCVLTAHLGETSLPGCGEDARPQSVMPECRHDRQTRQNTMPEIFGNISQYSQTMAEREKSKIPHPCASMCMYKWMCGLHLSGQR